MNEERAVLLENGNYVSIRQSGKDSYVLEFAKKDGDDSLSYTATIIRVSGEALLATAKLAVDTLGIMEEK